MYYRLNTSHTFNPKTHQNIAALNRVTEFLANGKVASEDEIRSALTGITNPHGDVVKWLARKSRKVIIPAPGLNTKIGKPTSSTTNHAEPMSGKAIPSNSLWSNPHNVDLDRALIYRIEIWTEAGIHYDYIGKARDASRLREYDRNMKKIHDRRERGTIQKYRAVHFALYQATQQNWQYSCYPLENCSGDRLNNREQQLIAEYPATLNDGRGWRVADIDSLTIEGLIRGQ